jgi:uncharacterized transporter YbjL
MVLVRARGGVTIHLSHPLSHTANDQRVKALFFLVSPADDPGRHLRILAQIAGRVDTDTFNEDWHRAADEAELREVLLRDERFLTLHVRRGEKTGVLAGKRLREIELPEGSLVALIRRGGEMIVPRGGTELLEGDRLTVIGSVDGVRSFLARYGE